MSSFTTFMYLLFGLQTTQLQVEIYIAMSFEFDAADKTNVKM